MGKWISKKDEKEEIKLLMSFLDSAANMFSQINNISSYVLDTPQEYIEKYKDGESFLDAKTRVSAIEEMVTNNMMNLEQIIHYLIYLGYLQ